MRERQLTAAKRKRVDARCDREVARRAAEQWGVLSTGELLACGLTHGAIGRRFRRGFLHRLYTGIWVVGHANPPPQGRLLAAVKACGATAVLSHRAAAQLWGLLDPADRDPEVTVVGSGTRVVPGIVVHRTAELPPVDTRRVETIPVTSPGRTLIDLAGVVGEPALHHAVRRALGLRLINLRQLLEVRDRLGPRRGSRKLAGILATGAAPTQSVLEDVVHDFLLAGGFRPPEVNQPMVIAGRRVIPDFRWPEQRLVLEADGRAWHDNPLSRAADTERQALLEADGERVLRVTWTQVVSQRAQTLARIQAAGAPLAG